MPTKIAVPTPSSPGVRVLKVGSGAGQDYADPWAVQTAVNAGIIKPLTNQEMVIAECYQDINVGNFEFYGLPFNEQDDKHYLIFRPVPGYAESDLSPDVFDIGTAGLQVNINNVTIGGLRRGVVFMGFRVVFSGNGSWGVGGPNPNGSPTPATYKTGFDRCRIVLNTTAAHAISMGEYNVSGLFEHNLVARISGSSDIEFFAVSHKASSNTFVSLNGTTGPMINANYTGTGIYNNLFVNVGPVPIANPSPNMAGNITNVALSTPMTGMVAVTGSPLVMNGLNNFIPADGSAALGAATDAAASVLDIRGANYGVNPDVGAWQKVPASPLPSGAVTGSPKPKGQQLRVPFTTTQNPTGGMATLSPAATNPGSAINNTGVLTFDNAADTGEAVFSDIAPGNYQGTITISNDGGPALVTGFPAVSILEITGSPTAGVTQGGEVPEPTGPLVIVSWAEFDTQAPPVVDPPVDPAPVPIGGTVRFLSLRRR